MTVVAPPTVPVRAGTSTINGVGELTKKLEIDEWGVIETPVYLCGTHAVGTVYQAAIVAAGGGPDKTVIPVVGECDDSDMGDALTVTAADVQAAIADLGEEVAEGTVGSGTGMTCFDFAGGIGTASRVVDGYTVGVLLMCNFGDRERLTVGGLKFDPAPGPPPPEGSCIAVCATDAPLSSLQLKRLSLRPLLGLCRAGSYASQRIGRDRAGVLRGRVAGLRQRGAVTAVRGCLRGGRGIRVQLPGRGQGGSAPRRPSPRGVSQASGTSKESSDERGNGG